MKFVSKQLARTPLRTCLFIVLIALAVVLLSVGVQLCTQSLNILDEIDSNFVTVGTIAQNPSSFRTVVDGIDSYDVAEYSDPVGLEELSELPYIIEPEHRPVLMSHMYRSSNGNALIANYNGRYNKFLRQLVVFKPTRDFILVPTEDQIENGDYDIENNRIEIVEILYGNQYADYTYRSLNLISYYSLSGEEPAELKEGELYVGWFSEVKEHSLDIGNITLMATTPYLVTEADEYSTNEMQLPCIVPYTEDFFDTKLGIEYQTVIEDLQFMTDEDTFPVIPVSSLDMYSAFDESEAVVTKGRAITEEEYASGAKVCMISETTNMNGDGNYVTVGDKITISPYAAYYTEKPMLVDCKQQGIWPDDRWPLNGFRQPEGEEYEIVGVYYSKNQEMTKPDSEYYMPDEAVIVPSKSINLNDYNVLRGNVLSHETTSFVIENGTIDSYLTEFEKLGLDNISIEFNDMGYTNIVKGAKSVLRISIILLVSGAVSALSIIILFAFLQIVRKKGETAISISLGTGIGKSAMNLILSVLIVIVIGTAIGSVAGAMSVDKISEAAYNSAQEISVDRTYSDVKVTNGGYEYTADYSFDPMPFALSALAVILASLAISGGATYKIVTTEPMKLLAKAGE
ncbi:MAG: hypothetical protein Q4C42_01565 [Clostridia bacterium]|nr:hypothetical protein [Clostridia bacterium]